MIKFLTYNKIDFQKWDKCISDSNNNLIYAHSWYLDVVCNNYWDALVLDDYKAVFPLHTKIKWGISIIRQPNFCQQLGVFATVDYDFNEFLNAIPNKFKYLNFNLNVGQTDHPLVVKTNTNHIIYLDGADYFSNYSSSVKKNVARARNRNVCLSKSPETIDSYMSSLLANSKDYMSPAITNVQYKVMEESLKINKSRLVSASLDGELCSFIFLLIDNKRLILLSTYSSVLGKANSAYFFLIDYVLNLEEYQGFTFDFEGANIIGVAKVNLGFGAKEMKYNSVRAFKLPIINKWLK